MRPIRWFAGIFILTALFAALVFGASRLGRGVDAILAAALVDEPMAEQDVFGLLFIDTNRGLGIRRRLYLPDSIHIDWSVSPPEVTQRIPSGESAVFIFSTLDAARGQLTALMTYTTVNARPRTVDMARAGSQAAVYDPDSGEVVITAPGQPQKIAATIDAGITPLMVWSPDGTRLAVKGLRSAPLALIDASGARYADVFRDSAPVWSPDSRYVLFTQDSFVERNGRIRAYDAATGEILPTVNDIAGRSGTWCGSGTLGYVEVTAERRHSVRRLDVATGVSSEVLGADVIGSQEIAALNFAPRAACDWLLLTMQTPNQVVKRMLLLHVATGELTPLGENVRILSLTPDAVIYDINTANAALTVSRAAFEAGTAPEIIGQMPSQAEAVRWYGDFRHGLFRREGDLWRIDLTAGTASRLPLNVKLRAFQRIDAPP